MKKDNFQDRIASFEVSSKKIFRIMKLSAFLLCATAFSVSGSKAYSNPDELPAKTEANATFVLQQNKVTGIVTDKNGAPVPGVNIVVTGTTIGAMTDIAGKYTIEVPKGSKSLTFSFIGMEPQEISIGTLSLINVTMSETAIGLDEVVVVGYGTQKKVNLTGSLSTISVKEIGTRPNTNVSSALQGTMPGVTVMVNNGQPGKDQGIIRVRGIGTLGNSNAMVMVDGIVSSMNDVNPSDIESITVLKDAASAAIYGSRASNGVILITTKKAKKGDITVHYNMYFGKQQPTALPVYLPSWQAASLQNEALISENKSPAYTDAEIQKFKDGSDPDRYPNTDWIGLFYKGTGFQQNHYFDISGGNEKSQNLVSFGYFSEDGIVKNTGLKRYTTRFKNTSTLGSHFTLNSSLAYTSEDFKEPTSPYNNNFQDYIWQINKTGNNVPYKTSNGYYGYGTDGNPIAWLESGALNKIQYNYITAISEGDLEIVKGLHFKPLLGFNLRTSDSKNRIKDIQYYNYTTGEPTWVQGPNKLFQSNTNYTVITLQALLQYSRTFGQHDFTILGGYSQEYSKYSLLSGYRYGFINNELGELDAGPINGQSNSGSASESALQSLFGRINYSFKTRYLIEANIRYDGSSRFAPNNRWSTFPSFSAGWRISEESFFMPLKGLFSDLKFRGSWGILGNQEVGSNYPYQSTIATGQNYTFGGVVANGMAPTAGANSGIKWEETRTTDFGLDAVFLKGKITFTGDYFVRNTDNILLRIPVGNTFGFRAPVVNAGSVQNKGYELALGYHAGELKNFTFDILANASFIKNTVTDLADTDPIISGYTFMKVGYPINSFYGYESEGFFQTQAQVDNHASQSDGVIAPGDIMYKDQNNDGVIDGADRVYLGTYFPKVTYGLNISMGWKAFDVTMFLQGASVVKGFVGGELIGKLTGSEGKPTEVFLNHWTPENPTNEFPRLWNSYKNNDPSTNCSSFWVRNSGYVRLKNLQVGYTLPSKLSSKLWIKNARIYWSGKDILTFTQFYKWVDPEAPAGETGYTYPKVMVNTIGINLTF
jgi:TonB-linked SusC/RagA family outer membrane protein